MQRVNLHKDGEKPVFKAAEFGGAGDEDEEALESSCSARDALRMQIVFPISITIADTWLAAAARRLTGNILELVACVLNAVMRLKRGPGFLPQSLQHVLINNLRSIPLWTPLKEPHYRGDCVDD